MTEEQKHKEVDDSVALCKKLEKAYSLEKLGAMAKSACPTNSSKKELAICTSNETKNILDKVKAVCPENLANMVTTTNNGENRVTSSKQPVSKKSVGRRGFRFM